MLNLRLCFRGRGWDGRCVAIQLHFAASGLGEAAAGHAVCGRRRLSNATVGRDGQEGPRTLAPPGTFVPWSSLCESVHVALYRRYGSEHRAPRGGAGRPTQGRGRGSCSRCRHSPQGRNLSQEGRRRRVASRDGNELCEALFRRCAAAGCAGALQQEAGISLPLPYCFSHSPRFVVGAPPSQLPWRHYLAFSLTGYDGFVTGLKARSTEVFEKMQADGCTCQVFLLDPHGL